MLGSAEVPCEQGNDLCYYAYLLLTKNNERGEQKPQQVKLHIEDTGVTIHDKNHVRMLCEALLTNYMLNLKRVIMV